jgi:transketolase
MTIADTQDLARRIRAHTVRMTATANASHVGTGLSMADILAVLYGGALRVDPKNPDWAERDRFVLSKGHGAAALYAALAERFFFPVAWLDDFCGDGGPLTGHVNSHGVPGVEASTGALGHGLSIGCGFALAGRSAAEAWRTVVVLSDGELDEGSTWEAILFAGHHRLGRLTAIVDYNGIQSFGRTSEVLDLEPLADKWRACKWHVERVDGHDIAALQAALESAQHNDGAPSVILAATIKGKGVSFMEDRLAWHYRSPRGDELGLALAELGADD